MLILIRMKWPLAVWSIRSDYEQRKEWGEKEKRFFSR